LLGINAYLGHFGGDRAVRQVGHTLAERLLAHYQANRADNWHWFADRLTYDNAVLPHALLLSGHTLDRKDMRDAGLEALSWLAALQRSESNHFVPISCHGFYRRDTAPARFDQQPLEAHAMVRAALDAHRITGNNHWLEEASRAFDWFLGRNDLWLPLYDPITGGCRDGLEVDRVNQNQGAESTLAFLIALLELGSAAERSAAELSQFPGIAASGRTVVVEPIHPRGKGQDSG
jgi:hypothetical protein